MPKRPSPKKKPAPKKPIGKSLSYAATGVDIDAADAAKERMAKTLETSDSRVLNSVSSWAFASLFDARFPGYEHPVLVLKTEEPGSKQVLAFAANRVESICQDMINHLINDIAVMGATPMAVQDCIVCGALDPDIVNRVVKGVADACRAQGCVLTGGETSVQPSVLKEGTYVLTSSIVGLVERAKVVDGSATRTGDRVLSVASNGPHTNGYTLIRALLKKQPKLAKKKVGGIAFLDAILTPHLCYYPAIKAIRTDAGLHGMAHITGSGIRGNLERVLPQGMDAVVHLDRLVVPEVFRVIRDAGKVSDEEMLKTYNMGTGLTLTVAPQSASGIRKAVEKAGFSCKDIGEIVKGSRRVLYEGAISW